MPIRYLVQDHDTEYTDLRNRLRAEWQDPQEETQEPVIIETTESIRPRQTPTHLYVIWSDWKQLPQRKRSEMMMDVYEQVKGRPAALNVTFAMGLTPDEADNLGIRYTNAQVD